MHTASLFSTHVTALPYPVLPDDTVVSRLPRPWKALRNRYKNKLTSAHHSRLHVKFLQRCMEEQVLPVTSLPLHLRCLNGLPFDTMEIAILERSILLAKQKKNSDYAELEALESEVRSTLPDFERSIVFRHCNRLLDSDLRELQSNLDSKLAELIKSSSWTTMSNHAFFTNMSSIKIMATFDKNWC